jgi:hypothetical protein
MRIPGFGSKSKEQLADGRCFLGLVFLESERYVLSVQNNAWNVVSVRRLMNFQIILFLKPVQLLPTSFLLHNSIGGQFRAVS